MLLGPNDFGGPQMALLFFHLCNDPMRVMS